MHNVCVERENIMTFRVNYSFVFQNSHIWITSTCTHGDIFADIDTIQTAGLNYTGYVALGSDKKKLFFE